MRQEEIQQFTYRISNANRSELVVVTYDILLRYLQEASVALEKNELSELKENIAKAGAVFERLKSTLDFKFELSMRLYEIYQFCETICYKAIPCKDKQLIDDAIELMSRLRESFYQVAKDDDSPVLMKNSQQITAGMTYGKGSLTESYSAADTNRGFWA